MRKITLLTALFLMTSAAFAERPPQSDKDATDIVTAKVARIYTSTEPFAGDGVMTHYIADLQVVSASKGSLKAGDQVSGRWFHVTKSPSKPLPAAYGHAYAIRPGDTVQVSLIRSKGGDYDVIYSNQGMVKAGK